VLTQISEPNCEQGLSGRRRPPVAWTDDVGKEVSAVSWRTEVPYPPPLGVHLPPPPAPPEDDGLRRVSPQQVLLAAGAVVLVAAGAASLALSGWVLPTALAVGTAAASLRCGRADLRISEETLAAATVVLVVIGDRAGSNATSAAVLAGLAVMFLVLGRLGRSAVTWPVAAWLTAQLAVLTALPDLALTSLPHTAAVLGTSLTGLLVTLRARRPVSVVALTTTAPWWIAGVVEGTHLVWTTMSVGTAALAATLMVGAAAGLLALRFRAALRPLLGPRPLVPVVAGAVTGAAVSGVLQAVGSAGVPAAGYLGLVTASLVAELASPRPHSLVRPGGLAFACTATALAVVQLLVDGRWTALALLLLAAAVPALLVAARQPADRPGALPIAVACLAGAALLAEADGTLDPGWTGRLLLALAVLALGAATLERHSPSEVPLAWSGVLVGLIAVVHVQRSGGTGAMAAGLAVLGAALVGYATRTEAEPARAGGCALLVAAAWLALGNAGVQVPEAYSLSLAAVLLLHSGRRLATAASWPAWGPALTAGYVPSVFLALVEPDLLRVLLVVGAATVTTTAATGWGVRAPFLVGASALALVAVGRIVAVLPAPGLVAFALAGAVLLAVGASYESRRRQAREAIATVADMR
jgi:hypothetical protein